MMNINALDGERRFASTVRLALHDWIKNVFASDYQRPSALISGFNQVVSAQRFGSENLMGGSSVGTGVTDVGAALAFAGARRGAGLTSDSEAISGAGAGVAGAGGSAAKPRSNNSVTFRSRAFACAPPIVTTMTRRPLRVAVADRQKPAPFVK